MRTWVIAGAVALSVLIGFRIWLTNQEEQARHDFENGRYCKSLNTYKWLSKLIPESLPVLAAFYAEGLCVQQDLDEARKTYGVAYKNHTQEIGRAFLYNGIGIAEADLREQKPLRTEMIDRVFAEAKKMGLEPTEKDWNALESVGLKDRFKQ